MVGLSDSGESYTEQGSQAFLVAYMSGNLRKLDWTISFAAYILSIHDDETQKKTRSYQTAPRGIEPIDEYKP